MNKYYIWTIGCQMNTADSERLASALEYSGLTSVDTHDKADVIVLNSCVVRQSAEDKVVGTLGMMKAIKRSNPDRVLALMGCMVGPKTDELKARFPYVDVFMKPQEYAPLLDLLSLDTEGCLANLTPIRPDISGYVPVIHGCDLMCTFCIIPFRRGRQVSRPMSDIVREVELLVQRGMREVTLLGQTVDAYGHDLVDETDLADLLYEVSKTDKLVRLGFLTSHPIFMTERIIQAVRDIDKVAERINLPVQSGDDNVLHNMRRRYDLVQYRNLVEKIKSIIPDVSLSTDIIVGFPGESNEEFENTLKLVEDVQFDKIHILKYSERPGTLAARKMVDDVSKEEKQYRFKVLEETQKQISYKKNMSLVGKTLDVLVNGQKGEKWEGRTKSDKLVVFDCNKDFLGEIVNLRIESASAWSLKGALV
ncbi:tRNA (N6-isopentenyl adenosine(37)-C2)-methylthiotransferase MiaB [SAR202 cluster bacterium AC-409-J13_OGT_754m]|nr:tRNA (N6-isopentenyl adenosine(37)-C2)-methylthiotransferase MiaB [SAR202 cluster bacterium AC-409-J13_OGT_754m]